MDTSDKYVKMCGKAIEIQMAWVLANGDFEVRLKHGRGQVEVHHHREMTAYYKPEDHLWLPRQDQLQEMLSWKFPNKFRYIVFVFFRDNKQFTSMEQFWLAFVMKEKYGKTWNGEDWV